ncbi:hypothetical protein C0X88_25205, partial [Escherichia coli O79]|nr:hypothetical protein [Escherichia coli O79]
WIQYLLSLVPDCPWQHIVFTLPCQYWSLVFHNRCVRHNGDGEKDGDANQVERDVSAVTEG